MQRFIRQCAAFFSALTSPVVHLGAGKLKRSILAAAIALLVSSLTGNLPSAAQTLPTRVLPARGLPARVLPARGLPPRRGPSQPLTSWPQFGGSNAHNSYSKDPAITSGNVSGLGVNWMANLFSPDLGSPVVGFNSILSKTVAYVGDERGDVFAVDTSNGQLVWSTNIGVGDSIRATPAIADDGSLWVGTVYNPTLYKLNGATGAVDCKYKTNDYIDGSPMIATPAGGSQLVYVTSNNNHTGPGPLFAIRESNCTVAWTFQNYIYPAASSWTTPGFGVDSSGRSLVLIGTTDPDNHAYAIDAITGARVWDFFPQVGPGTWDLGATPAISPPGQNGFANGVAYMQSKYGLEFALDLKTGALIWQYQMQFNSPTRDARSAAALKDNTLVYGFQDGVQALNATTGRLRWQYTTPLEVVSGPVAIGPSGSEVVAFGDITGTFRVVSLATGAQLYAYKTGSYITSSPAELKGNFYIASSDGFLYSYKVGGSNAAPSATTITAPVNLSKIPNPNGNVSITGISKDAAGVAAVELAIQANGSSGPWYDATSGKWMSAPVRNQARLANPGSTTTSWSFALPVPAGGGAYEVFANTVNIGHIVDRGTVSSFSVNPSKSAPTLTVSAAFVPPAGAFDLSGNAFTPGEQVQITFLDAVVATVKADGSGSIPKTEIDVKNTAPFGPTSVTATGLSSGKTSSITVGVTNNWTQAGFGAARTSFEPNDWGLAKILDIGKGTVLQQSWTFQTNAAVNSSPAVVDGILYVGNDAGTLSAIVASTGAPKWSYTTPTKAAIRSTPATDQNGNIIFGANDGTLYLIDPSGVLKKKVSLNGNLSSAAISDGQIFIASDSGTMYDLADPAGTITWTTQMPATVHSSPSYDAANHIVVVGDDAGNVTALKATTGAPIWQLKTGGPVTANAAIQAGIVWIGSGDGTMYALKETTGTLLWKFTADSAIVAGGAVNGANQVTFGSKKGTLYLMDSTGNEIFAQTKVFGNTAIVGNSDITSNFFVETAGGLVGGSRLDAGSAQYPFFQFQTNGSLSTAPTVVDGAIYVGAGDGNVYAFTPHGKNPVPASKRHATPIITLPPRIK